MDKNFVLPRYDGENYINIIDTIKSNYNLKHNTLLKDDDALKLIHKHKKVVFLLVDAFGWESYKKVKERSAFLQSAEYSKKITSQFPSTTTAHVTSLVTGEAVSEHGFFEWFCYDNDLDELFVPFLFDYTNKELALPKVNLFNDLLGSGVKSKVFSPEEIQHSYYSRKLFENCEVHPFKNAGEMFSALKNELLEEGESCFYYCYYCEYDSKCHEHGIGSKESENTLNSFINSLDNFYKEISSYNLKDTTFILTADHGQTIIKEKYYINLLIPDIDRYIKKNREGKLITPVGYNRDMFIYTQEKDEESVIDLLTKALKDKAKVYKTKDLIKKGLFVNPSSRFLERVGNIVIIPYEHIAIWWFKEGEHSISLTGTHGGLSKSEMEIPLVIKEL